MMMMMMMMTMMAMTTTMLMEWCGAGAACRNDRCRRSYRRGLLRRTWMMAT
jgi:hypothetical protein